MDSALAAVRSDKTAQCWRRTTSADTSFPCVIVLLPERFSAVVHQDVKVTMGQEVCIPFITYMLTPHENTPSLFSSHIVKSCVPKYRERLNLDSFLRHHMLTPSAMAQLCLKNTVLWLNSKVALHKCFASDACSEE